MRSSTFALIMLFLGAAAPAWALEPRDTMQAWKHASTEERTKILAEILGKPGAGVLKCMDETSAAPGHADLPIADVAKACASAKGAGEPV